MHLFLHLERTSDEQVKYHHGCTFGPPQQNKTITMNKLCLPTTLQKLPSATHVSTATCASHTLIGTQKKALTCVIHMWPPHKPNFVTSALLSCRPTSWSALRISSMLHLLPSSSLCCPLCSCVFEPCLHHFLPTLFLSNVHHVWQNENKKQHKTIARSKIPSSIVCGRHCRLLNLLLRGLFLGGRFLCSPDNLGTHAMTNK